MCPDLTPGRGSGTSPRNLAADLASTLPWHLYRQDTKYHMVIPMESLDRLDPASGQEMMAKIMGTEGESHLMAAMESMGAAGASMTSQFMQVVPEWTYYPASYDPESQTMASIFEAWLKYGVDEAYDENARDIMGMLKEMSYPYPVIGHRTLVGEGGKVSFAVLHDGLAEFYGPNAIDNVASPAQLEAWGKAFEAQDAMVMRRNSFNAVYVPELSNAPTGMNQ